MAKTKYVRKDTPFGYALIPMTRWERIVDRALPWVGRAFKVGGYLLLIALLIGYVSTCSPYWFRPILEAPLICIGAR